MSATREIEIDGKTYVYCELTGGDVSKAFGKCGNITRRGEFNLDVEKFLDYLLRVALKNATLKEIKGAPASTYCTLLNEIVPQIMGAGAIKKGTSSVERREKKKPGNGMYG